MPHFKMSKKLIILWILISGFNHSIAQNIDGLWKEVYWSPMTSYYYFNTIDSTFKSYYLDDTFGSFGKGKFIEKSNRLILKYDSIECDKPILERFDDDLMRDTTGISFFHYWGFPKRVDIISDGEKIYSNWTLSSDSIIEDYLFIEIPKKLDLITVEIYDSNGTTDKLITSFKCRLYEKPFCNLYYYPSESWYKYENSERNEIKVKWKGQQKLEIKGKNKYGFKKIK